MSSFEKLFNLGKKKNVSVSSNNGKTTSKPAYESDFYGHHNALKSGYYYDPSAEYNLKNAIVKLLNARDFVNESDKKEFTRKELKFVNNWFATSKQSSNSYNGMTDNKFTLAPSRIETFKIDPYGDGEEIDSKRYYYSSEKVLDFIRDSLKQLKENSGLDRDIKYLSYQMSALQEKIDNLKAIQYVLENC